MIAALGLEVLLIGLAVWQLIGVRRSLRADRERRARDRNAADEP